MKKIIATLLSATLVFSLTACNQQPESVLDSMEQQSDSAAIENTVTNSETIPDQGTASTHNQSNILIAYFTWAENTVVENPDSIDVDASTSASVLPPGNAAKIAGWIQDYVGGDLFSIVVTEPYSSDYDECLDRAADEKAQNARPQLVNHVENMDDYDIVFLGFPNWWYTVPMAIQSFLEEYDFSGKTIVPFVTHGTGGLASTIQDITATLPGDVTILQPIGVYRPDVDTSQPAVEQWLQEQGFDQNRDAVPVASQNSTEKKITMAVDGQNISIVLHDTPAANALYDMLPLELTFEDYNGIEKISYLPEQLPTDGEPSGCDPEVGDFCLYAPWGNLSIFYEDFGQSSGLIPLGYIENDIETIGNMNSDFTVVLEAAE